ncbi:MAG: Nramp family divalent metal transporter [Acidobacteriota bacterium]
MTFAELRSRLGRLGPGVAIAATGVGAGDLIAASVGGVRFGTVLAWSVLLGAGIKFVLNEGIARWQLGQGVSLLRAVVDRFPPAMSVYLAIYFLVWTPAVAAALAAACGIAAAAVLPVASPAAWGTVHTVVAAGAVLAGGYPWLERSMKGLIAVMFAAILGSALWLRPGVEVLRGLLLPSVPGGSTVMILSIIGGVGGSVTLLAYGYWIEAKGWRGREQLGMARLDLGVAYGLTGLFGVAVLVLAASLDLPPEQLGTGTGLLIGLADRVGGMLGPAAHGLFLAGVWAAVFTSMLGVWHGVPALLADFLRAADRRYGGPRLPAAGARDPVHAVLVFAVAAAAAGLVWSGRPLWLILVYTVLGSLFMPLLAFFLLWLNRRRGPLGTGLGNRPLTAGILGGALLLYLFLGVRELADRLGGSP